jgi:hypothetical protein
MLGSVFAFFLVDLITSAGADRFLNKVFKLLVVGVLEADFVDVVPPPRGKSIENNRMEWRV